MQLFSKDCAPLNWDASTSWPLYKDMLTMAVQCMDDDGELYAILCGRIADAYFGSPESQALLAKRQRKLKQTLIMSRTRELAALYCRAPTGTAMWAALCKAYEVGTDPQIMHWTAMGIEAELRQIKYDPRHDHIGTHLLRMTNKQLELAELGHPIALKSYVLQSLPRDIDEFEMVQMLQQHEPAETLDELETQIRRAGTAYAYHQATNNASRRGRHERGRPQRRSDRGKTSVVGVVKSVHLVE